VEWMVSVFTRCCMVATYEESSQRVLRLAMRRCGKTRGLSRMS
jgi:hypothetical protein